MELIYLLATLVNLSPLDGAWLKNPSVPHYDTKSVQYPSISVYDNRYVQHLLIPNYDTQFVKNSPISTYDNKHFPNPPISTHGTQYFPNPLISLYRSKSVPNSPVSIYDGKSFKNPPNSIDHTKFVHYPSVPGSDTKVIHISYITIFSINFPLSYWLPANFPSKLPTPAWRGEHPTYRTRKPTNRSPTQNSSVCAHHECETTFKNSSMPAPSSKLPEMHTPTSPMPDSSVTPGGLEQTGMADKMKLLPLNDCGVVTADRITNGEDTSLGQFPWMALLGYRLSDGSLAFLCGGTLINSQYILTAAHCVKKQNDSTLELVRLGEHNIDTEKDCNTLNITDENIPPEELEFYEHCADPVQDIPIDAIISHENFNSSTLKNDIALLRLRKLVDRITDYIRPICLPFGLNITETTDKYQVAGWGQLQSDWAASSVLQTASIFSMPLTQCDLRQPSQVRPLDYTQLCVGADEGKDVCKGDSGGPLMKSAAGRQQSIAQTYQIGIVSFGVSCGSLYIPSVYTRVTAYLDWILNNIEP